MMEYWNIGSFLHRIEKHYDCPWQLWNLAWYAFIGTCLLDPRFSVQYIGRYTKRAVMAEYRIIYYDGKIVRFSYKDYAHGAKTRYMTLKVYTFMGRTSD